MVLLTSHPPPPPPLPYQHQTHHSPQLVSDEDRDPILHHAILDRHSLIKDMAAYGQPSEHFDPNRSFMPAAHPAWSHPMQFNQQYMFLPNQSHQKQARDFPASEEWDHHTQSPLAVAPQNNPFQTYPPEPVVKAEEAYPTEGEHHPHSQLPASAAPESQQTQPTSATSPQSETGWMSNSSSETAAEKSFKREHLPLVIDNPPRLRSDGIRKKNARFDIPEERKIHTIDDIISQTDPNDEKLMKELKQQKRLLRNRQAALDSRCRKKEFTQKLEHEKRLLEQNYALLQEDYHQLRQQQEMWHQERASWHANVERVNWEKEEMLRKHTLETAELRKKNNFLMEDAQRRSSMSMSTVPSSAGYSSTFSEFDHLSMNDSPTWNEFSLLQHNHPEPEMQVAKPQQPTHVMPKDVTVRKEEGQTPASGLLLMLLLCGAWVASNGSSSATELPQMSEDVREASATVLDNIYKDAGLNAPGGNDKALNVANQHDSSLPAVNPFDQQNNPFVAMHHLAAPSLQQQREEVFSLTPTQYNALTTDENLYSTPQPSPKVKRHLQDALSSLQLQRRGTASEVYTKSLMWDEVPTEVVKDFARMMSNRAAEPMS